MNRSSFPRIFTLAVLLVALTGLVARADDTRPPEKNEGFLLGTKSRLTLFGRAAIGIIDAEDSGGFNGTGYPNSSIAMPDAKLDFRYAITENVTGRLRLSVNNAAAATPDRLYVEVAKFLKQDWLNLRLGLGRINFGEACDVNNPVDNWGISNSAADVSGTDEGIMLFGDRTFQGIQPFGAPLKILYDVGVWNGAAGVLPDISSAKAWSTRLGLFLNDAWYVSGHYFSSGNIGNSAAAVTNNSSNAALSIANTMINAPGGTGTWWDRTAWEVDAQWRFAFGNRDVLKKGPRWSKSDDKLGSVSNSGLIRGNYGQFSDEPGIAAPIREGDYWSVEGVYNVTPKIYLGGVYSAVNLDGTATGRLNRVTTAIERGGQFLQGNSPQDDANSYTRATFYAGFNLTERTNIKAEYAANESDYPTAVPQPEQDYWALMLTTYF